MLAGKGRKRISPEVAGELVDIGLSLNLVKNYVPPAAQTGFIAERTYALD